MTSKISLVHEEPDCHQWSLVFVLGLCLRLFRLLLLPCHDIVYGYRRLVTAAICFHHGISDKQVFCGFDLRALVAGRVQYIVPRPE